MSRRATSILEDQVYLCSTLIQKKKKKLHETSKVIVYITHLGQASIRDLLLEDQAAVSLLYIEEREEHIVKGKKMNKLSWWKKKKKKEYQTDVS